MQQKKYHYDYDCFDCHAGKYSKAGATVCLSCGPGTYSDARDDNCYYCAPGKYAPDANTAKCTDCPAGSTVFEIGSTNARACVCKPGYTWDYMAHVSTNEPPDCLFCAGGKYKIDYGFQECQLCQAGKYKAFGDILFSSGSCCRPDCDNCPAHSYSAAAVSLALSAAMDNTLNPRDARTVLQASIFRELHVCHASSTLGRLKAVLCVSATLATSVYTVVTSLYWAAASRVFKAHTA
jgi:hypothetical protein